MSFIRAATLLIVLLPALVAAADLRISVYATAGNIQHEMATDEGRAKVLAALRGLSVTHIFLEGRRGDEYVAPEMLKSLREYFERNGIAASGGIATVPGQHFAQRQKGDLAWLNWESVKTRADIANFFRENAPVFDEIVVDDFFCTGDESAESDKARNGRPWGEYRQDLMTSLIEPLILKPAREANPRIRLILKYPQWYDRFHMFGYAPARMSPPFDRIWVGTEVRNPETRRMGFVQPTQGYMNFRWISAVSGKKVEGAWFDHIECTAQNFVDQAWQSVLAGAGELTLFNLGNIMEGHPGHALLKEQLPAMRKLAAQIDGKQPRGVAFYKPSGSESGENMYLMDYMGMLGLPVVPTATYPAQAKVIVLGLQATADPELLRKARASLKAGATLIVTPAAAKRIRLPKGRVITWDIHTFTEEDFAAAGEHLLAPTQLPIMSLSQAEVDSLRKQFLKPLGMELSAPTRVGFYDFGTLQCFYNFHAAPTGIVLNGKQRTLPANSCTCEGN